jgi:fibronectin type 3 domain-containing protein
MSKPKPVHNSMQKSLSRFVRSPRNLVGVAFVIVFASIGTYALFSSHAAVACTATATSVSDAVSKVNSAANGDVVCMAAGTYGSITLTGNHTANVTFEPDPSLDPSGAGKVTFNGMNITGNYITVRNFYSTGSIYVGSPSGPANNNTVDHNNVGPTSGWGIAVLSAIPGPPSTTTVISNNIIHDTSHSSEGDGIRLQGWKDVTVIGNEIYNVGEGPACTAGGGNICHTDTLQSFQNGVATSTLKVNHNYIHDVDGQGIPFLKDGDISDVQIKDNLEVRNSWNATNGIDIDENVNGLVIQNNTYPNPGNYSAIRTEGSGTAVITNLDHNIFGVINATGYTYTNPEDYDIYTTTSPGDIFQIKSGPHSAFNTSPGFKCGSICGNGTLAGDDYELASNPNNIGVDWAPANQSYGPVSGAGSGGTTTPPPADTTAPTVSMTAPANNATVSGSSVVLSATASDNVAVANVQFKLDGNNLGAADTSSPYSFNWDTTGVSNGKHTLSAVATDTSNNTTASNSVTVTVSNSSGAGNTTGGGTGSTAGQANCANLVTSGASVGMAHPGACGYPDPSYNNVGVANCAALPASGSITASTAGQTIQNLNVTGTINITANNVTINNVCVTDNGAGAIGSTAVNVGANVTGTVINNSTIAGANATNQSMEAAVRSGSSGASGTLNRDYLYQCGECAWGHWTINDSYIIANGMIGTGDHYEDIYFSDGTVNANHDTLLNPEYNTAVLFGDTQYGGGGPADNHTTITNSLFGGGDIVLYPNGNSSAVGSSTMTITGNRLLRCITKPSVLDNTTGGTACTSASGNDGTGCTFSGGAACQTGQDANGYYPGGGYFGLTTKVYTGTGQTWSGNVWDDNLALVSASGSAGSGTGDSVPPSVSLSAPINASTVSGTVAVAATASDNVGVSSVQLQVDGSNVGSADTAAPYNFNWNSSSVSSGTHTLRVVAKDAAGNTATSSTVSVTVNSSSSCGTGTLAAPTSIIKTSSTYTGVTLSWTAPSPTPGCSITGYKVFRNGTQVGTTTGATSYPDSGLVSGTSYNYSVQATDSGNNTSAQSATASLATKADDEAPNVPANVTATTASQPVLAWSAVTDNPNPGGSGVKGYNVYRGTSSATIGSTPLNSAPLTATTYTDTTANASTKYSYVITAIDNVTPLSAANESAPSTVVTATTPAPTCSGTPSTPGTPVKMGATINSISFNWAPSTDTNPGCSLSGYHIYRSDKGAAPIADVTDATAYTDSLNLSPNTSYSYTIKAFDNSGHISAGATIAITTAPDTAAPTAPGSVTATATASSQVNLAWTASTDNVGVTGYNVYRGGSLLKTVSGTTLSTSDNTVSANTSYTYLVSAIDAANNEGPKLTATPNPVHTPASIDSTAPSAPTTVNAPAITTDSASLTWTVATDTGGSGVSGYHIYLNGVYDGDTSTTSFALSCIAPSVSYTVTVKAFDGAGNVGPAATKAFASLSGGLQGDLNCDGAVNSTDLFTMLRNWQSTDALPPAGDVTGDTNVNSTDLFDLLRNWGKTS